MKVTGGCHCGHITYEAEVDPATVRVCHCTDCQKLTGTAFRANIASLPDTSKNRWQSRLIADSVLLGLRGIGDGGTAGIFRQRRAVGVAFGGR
jgi:hypothetical protein